MSGPALSPISHLQLLLLILFQIILLLLLVPLPPSLYLQLLLLLPRRQGGTGQPAAQPYHQARDLVYLLREQFNLETVIT